MIDVPYTTSTSSTGDFILSGSWFIGGAPPPKPLRAYINEMLEKLGEPPLGDNERATLAMYEHLKKQLQGE